MNKYVNTALEAEIGHWMDCLDDKYCSLVEQYSKQDIKETARYFAEWGAIHLNARKEELYNQVNSK